jgi:hypothetical protein
LLFLEQFPLGLARFENRGKEPRCLVRWVVTNI